MPRFDIRRRIYENDTNIGGVSVTSTAVETRFIDIQPLGSAEVLALGGLRIEAQYRGFCHEDTSLREGDIITNDSGTTRYEIVNVESLWNEHTEFLARKN